MLMPKRVKHRKQFRGRMKGKAQRGNTLAYGEFGLQATEPHWVTSQQIEAARIALTRIRTAGHRTALGYQPADRGGPYRPDPLHQAWRSGMDQDFPRQTGNGQARRDPHGFR